MIDIHHHILFDILLYLPVMSLLRFKSVCKTWFSLIESSAFINEHLKYNSGKEDDLIIINHHSNFNPRKTVAKMVLLSGSQYEDRAYIDFDRLLWHPLNNNMLLSGSCNGIICLQQRRTLDVALWNPALNQLRPLPPPLFSSRYVPSAFLSYAYGAFGIDVKTNDCKVLKIFPVISEKFEVVGNQVEVYSLRDNCWRIIHEIIVLPFLKTCLFDVALPCSNGMCFWMRLPNHRRRIITFDFTDEVFGTMSAPDGEYLHSDPCKLDTYDGKIIYIRLRGDHNNHNSLKLEIWMLCEGESWTKIYMTEPSPPLDMMIDPVGLFKNGEYFICKTCFERGRPNLYMYNLHTQEGKFLGPNPAEIIRYNPSLVSVKSANEI